MKTPSFWNYLSLVMLLALLTGCTGASPTLTATQPPPATATPFPTHTPAPSPAPTATLAPLGPLTWSGKQRPLLMVHTMPWYQAPPTSSSWGYHWTMNTFTPTQTSDGKWENFASHYTPLTGLYDSSDPALLDYQVQLMKLSGIDGVIVDWYSMENFDDYRTLNEATGKLFQAVKKAGLKFVICYEDRTVQVMVDNLYINQSKAVPHAQKAMKYLQDTWFPDESYLKFAGRPVLLNFGPMYFKDDESWKSIFSVLPRPPVFVVGDQVTFPTETAAYPWPPMWLSKGGVITQDALSGYLDSFYSRAQLWPYHVGGAFPGFYDIYKEANSGESFGYLDALGGRTFRYTLQAALDQKLDMIQLITWNDYGEGTNIEPTVEYGYQYLEVVQEARKAMDTGFVFKNEDLRLPLELYQLKVKHAADDEALKKLDEAGQLILDGNFQEAKLTLASFK